MHFHKFNFISVAIVDHSFDFKINVFLSTLYFYQTRNVNFVIWLSKKMFDLVL